MSQEGEPLERTEYSRAGIGRAQLGHVKVRSFRER